MHPDNSKTVDTSKPEANNASLDSEGSNQELYRFQEDQLGLYHVNIGVEGGEVQLLPLEREGGPRTLEEPIALIDQMRPSLEETVDKMIMKKIPGLLKEATNRAIEEATNLFFTQEDGV